MPRTAIAPQQIKRSGLTPVFAAANAAGHSVDNDNRTYVHVKTGATGVTVTVDTPGTVDGQAIGNPAIVIGTNTEALIGPFPPDTYNQPDGSGVNIDFSQVVTVTVAALRL